MSEVEEIIQQSEENTEVLYVVLIVNNDEDSKILKRHFETNIAKKEETVIYNVVERDSHPSLQIYKEGDLVGRKPYLTSDGDEDEPSDDEEDQLITDVTQAKNDMSLFVMAHLYTHHNPQLGEMFSDEEDADDEDNGELSNGTNEDSQDEDENYEPSEDQDEEDQDEEDQDEDEDDYMDEEEHQVGNTINQEEILQIWHDILPRLEGNELYFTTFRNSLSSHIKDIFFRGNKLFNVLSNVADLPPPEKEDLDEIIKEASTYTPIQDLSQHIEKYKPSDSDNFYLHDDDLKEEEEEIAQDQYEKIEWRTFGVDIQRLLIGSFNIAPAYRGQFRIKCVDSTLIYDMFVFVAHPPPQVVTTHEELREYMFAQCDAFKESKRFRMLIDLKNVIGHFYFESKADPGLSLLTVSLKCSPVFSYKIVKDNSWTTCGDFTTGQQAASQGKHYVLANHETLRYVAYLVSSCSDKMESVDQQTLNFDAGRQQQTDVEHLNVFETQQNAETSAGTKNCCIQ
ncbi:hypothetical protein AKO1_006805 [Acrasis kona]|uniref:Uncharacterized protein n=1 Tax=Acrasis kona TaxID=1008807 RepID=A0AAW2YUE0_9EUKA